MISSSNNENGNTSQDVIQLLDKMQAAIEVEKALTATIERVEPWLRSSGATTGGKERAWQSSSSGSSAAPRVRPIPETVEQAVSILHVARNWASRTSAPAGWTPAAPVIGFSTPSPLPHQLRGGALATLQLERAKQQLETANKRQKLEQQRATAAAAAAAVASKQHPQNETDQEAADAQVDKEQNLSEHPRSAKTSLLVQHPHPQQRQQQQQQQQQRPARPKQNVSMNLSDSSSSDEDDDDMQED